jgi:hypothetical protein
VYFPRLMHAKSKWPLKKRIMDLVEIHILNCVL